VQWHLQLSTVTVSLGIIFQLLTVNKSLTLL
jgi:hypothetical protein